MTTAISNSESHLLSICVDMSLWRIATFLYSMFTILARWRQLQSFLRISQRSLRYSPLTDVPLFSVAIFNIHVDDTNDSNGKRLLRLLQSSQCIQHVRGPTHTGGHILDLIVTRDDEPVSDMVVGEFISDHTLVTFNIPIAKKLLEHIIKLPKRHSRPHLSSPPHPNLEPFRKLSITSYTELQIAPYPHHPLWLPYHSYLPHTSLINSQRFISINKPTHLPPQHFLCHLHLFLLSFTPVTILEIDNLLSQSSDSYCDLEPVPTTVLKKMSNAMSSTILSILNLSITTGTFPSTLKSSIISPL